MARQVYGTVGSQGEIHSGSGFRVTRWDTGYYQVEFDQPFHQVPVVVATVSGHPWRTFNMSTAISDHVGHGAFFFCLTSTPDRTEDCGFSFIAIGD